MELISFCLLVRSNTKTSLMGIPLYSHRNIGLWRRSSIISGSGPHSSTMSMTGQHFVLYIVLLQVLFGLLPTFLFPVRVPIQSLSGDTVMGVSQCVPNPASRSSPDFIYSSMANGSAVARDLRCQSSLITWQLILRAEPQAFVYKSQDFGARVLGYALFLATILFRRLCVTVCGQCT